MMEPLVSIRFSDNRRCFRPGETFDFDCQLDAVEQSDLQAVELSVLWYTEGKGDEDMGVHYFERRKNTGETDLRELYRVSAKLPLSPLSYDGKIVKIRWCARVRCFLRKGREVHQDLCFQLQASEE
jgi:hypothetical protein